MRTVAVPKGLQTQPDGLVAEPRFRARLRRRCRHARTPCGAVGLELKLCQEGADAWAKQTGNEVKVISTPNSATERLALYQQLLAAKSPDIDVFQIDVIWPGILANHFVDLTGKIPAEEVDQHFKAIVENNTVGGKLVAMPWFTDAGMLFYRKDLLEAAGKQPPETWQELAATAKELQDQGARRRQRPDVGLRLPGQGLRGPDLQRARMDRQLRRRPDRRRRGQDHHQQPQGRRGADLGGLDGRHDRAGRRAQLQRGGGARRLPVRQRDLHAQLALRLGAGPGRGQPDQGQDRRRRPARRRPDGEGTPARWAAGSSRCRATAPTPTSRSISSAT